MSFDTVSIIAALGLLTVIIGLFARNLAEAAWYQWLLAIIGAAAMVTTIVSFFTYQN